MRCFIHDEAEAVSVCKKCGKPMCASCSKHGSKDNICPECLKSKLENELKNNKSQINVLTSEYNKIEKQIKTHTFLGAFFGFLFVIMLIGCLILENAPIIFVGFMIAMFALGLSSFITIFVEKAKFDPILFKTNNLSKRNKALETQINQLQSLLNIIVTKKYL